MADNHLTFKIGSAFSGEGFTKAQQAVKNVNGEIKNASRAASQIASAFGQMDASASKSMQALTGVIGALATFNVTAIATQGMMMAINAYFDSMKEKAEAAKASADALKVSMEKAFAGALSGRMAEVSSEIKSISWEFESVTKQANQFAAALEGVRSAEANGGVISLQVEKLNALLEAHSDAERANIEASYNLKIAIEKSANVEAEWQSKINAATDARTENANRIANIDKQLAVITENRRQLEETMATARESGDNHYLEIQKKVNALKEQEVALEQKKIDAEDQNKILDLKLREVKQQAANAQANATIEIRNAELAEVKLNEAKKAREVKENAARDAADEKAAADLLYSKEVKTAAQIQADANKAAQDLAAAEREYEAALRNYNSHINKNIFNEEGRDRSASAAKSRQQRAADVAIAEGLKNGTIRDSKSWHDVEMAAQRAQRDYESSREANQIRRDDARYQRLKDMNPRAMSKADKKWLEEEGRRRAARDEERKKLQDAENKKKEAERANAQMQKDVSEIRKHLEKLGLK